uniref:CCHC-type domain-containing protein n=1 Tax=Ananas comosus var. bracteatus TaxID=296719 RepID=A0A6V7QH50_ANACO|nr:unnamed protein product [Ananas comosus var. bracteatus]
MVTGIGRNVLSGGYDSRYLRLYMPLERGNAITREERDSFEKEKDKTKKHAAGGSEGQLSSKRPPRYPRSQWRGAGSQSKSRGPSQFVICGGDHQAIGCPHRERRCYRCDQTGHISHECQGGASPTPSAASPKVSQAAPSGRVFAAQVEEPAVVADVVAVQIGDWIMLANLLVLSRMKGFDIILGIDWLSKYNATIDCESRVITFREPGQEKVVYRACKGSLFALTVSASRARKLINSGCVAYLASVVETQKALLILGDIPVVPSGKVGEIGAEPTGNFVVVLTPLFPQSRDRASRRATVVKVLHLSQRPPELGLHLVVVFPYFIFCI